MDRRELFFRDIERGDIVIGRISSIREFGFFMVLICLGSGIMRDISHLEITVSYLVVIIPCKNYVLIQFLLNLPVRILWGIKYKLKKNTVALLTESIRDLGIGSACL